MADPAQSKDGRPSILTDHDVERIGALLTSSHTQHNKTEKDGWDKAGIVAQLLSGVVIAGLRIGLAWTAGHTDRAERERESELLRSQADAQSKQQAAQTEAQLKQQAAQSEVQLKQQAAQADAQLKLTREQGAQASAQNKAELELQRKKSAADFATLIRSGTDIERAEALGFLGTMLPPSQAVDIAIEYAHPPADFLEWPRSSQKDKTSYEGKKLVSDKAIDILGHLANDPESLEELRRISKTGLKPDSEIANGVLGQRPRVWVRESAIDDSGHLQLFLGNSVKKTYRDVEILQDPGWFEVTNDLMVGNNHLFFWVHNNGGPCSGRFEVSVGSQQYDTGKVYIENCAANSNAIGVYVGLDVSADGSIRLLEEMPQFQ
jgi:hypothetical protein